MSSRLKVHRVRPVVMAVTFVGLMLPALSLCLAQTPRGSPGTGPSAQLGLKGVFLEEGGAQSEMHGIVGRLGVFLVTPGGLEQVRPDHKFRTGDRFRFEITSNKDGWLHILHSSPVGKVQQLWPQEASAGENPSSNRMSARQTYMVPSGEGVFVFEDEVGEETFYVALMSENTPPSFTVLTQPASGTESKAPADQKLEGSTTIENFYIKDPFGVPERGVVFLPGTREGDAYVYFSSLPEDSKTASMIRFKLLHVE